MQIAVAEKYCRNWDSNSSKIMLKTEEFTPLQKVVNFLVMTVVLLAPLKMGSMILPGVPQGTPQGVWDVLLNALPVPLLAVFSGVLLVLTILAYKVDDCLSFRTHSGRLLWLWLLLPVVSVIGFINADSLESPVIFLEYTLMLSSFAVSVALSMNSAGADFRRKLFNCVTAGTIFTALWGAHQYFFGFADMRQFILEQEQAGIYIAPEIKARALDVRTYATFGMASALAGMFCLAGALTASKAWAGGRKFDPPRVSQWVFLSLTVLLCGGIFLTTKGRSAFLSVIVASAASGFIFIKSRKVKAAVGIGALALIIAGACYIHFAGRGFGSMTERVGYLKSSGELLLKHPFCGGGWGNFTFHHAINKSFGNEELAKDPHNFVASFASQTGVVGAVLTAMLIFCSLFAAYKALKKGFSLEKLAVFFGLSAFSFHMLMDLDWQVAGLMIWFAVFGFAASCDADENAENKVIPAEKYSLTAIAVLIAVLTVAGSLHWSIADSRHYALQEAAGQQPGTPQQPMDSFTVDRKAREALSVAPYSHSIYMVWGNDALRRGDLNAAEERYNKALEIVPRSHAVYDRLGDVYKLRGDVEKAAAYYDKADKLFPYKKIFFEGREKKGSEK